MSARNIPLRGSGSSHITKENLALVIDLQPLPMLVLLRRCLRGRDLCLNRKSFVDDSPASYLSCMPHTPWSMAAATWCFFNKRFMLVDIQDFLKVVLADYSLNFIASVSIKHWFLM